MNQAQILARLDEERRCLVRDQEEIETLPLITRSRACGKRYTVAWSALNERSASEAIDREIEHHRRLGVGFEWKVFAHDAPADLIERLRDRGFQIGAREAVLIYDLAHRAAWIENDSMRVERISNLEQVNIFKEVAADVFGKDYGQTAGELADALATGSTQHLGYIVYAGDEPAGIGRLYTHPESWFGGLYGGGTRKALRGRGLYRAMVAARARDAMALGVRFLQVDALPTSRPILEKMNFEWLTGTWPCEWGMEQAGCSSGLRILPR